MLFADLFKSRIKRFNLVDSFLMKNRLFFIVIFMLSLPFFAIFNDGHHLHYKDNDNHFWVVKKEKFAQCNDSLVLEKSPNLMDFKVSCFANKSDK